MRKTLAIFFAISVQFIGNNNTNQLFSISMPKDPCEVLVEDSTAQDFFKKNLENIKNYYKSIKDTTDLVEKSFLNSTNVSMPTHLMGKITHDCANLVNTINKIAQSEYLMELNETDIHKVLCKCIDFINKFSESLISDPKGKPIKDLFKGITTSDWFKEGLSNIDFSIKTLVKHVDRDDSQLSIVSYLPSIKSNYRELTDTVCRMLKDDNEVFINDILDLLEYIKNFEKILSEIESNSYLVQNKEMKKIKPINTTVKKLQGYFTSLSDKLSEVKEQINPNMACSELQADLFAQEIIHVIFMYKHNKLDYKQMNNEVNKLATMIKELQSKKI